MAAYDLEEQEQISALKAWWNQYGNLITGIAVAAAIAAVGYQGWNWYKRNQALQASAVYGVLQKAAGTGDAKAVRDAAGELLEKYSGTAYAALGALLSGKVHFESGDLKTARVQFEWAASHAPDAELRDIARLRLASVLLDEKAFDEALKQVQKAEHGSFAARFGEMRGDVLTLQGKRTEAASAYRDALAKLPAASGSRAGGGDILREVLNTKLEALGEKP